MDNVDLKISFHAYKGCLEGWLVLHRHEGIYDWLVLVLDAINMTIFLTKS